MLSEESRFPLTAKYDREWVKQNSLGQNVLYDLESLCEVIEFKPGMRVLDLGCGKTISSIFLAKEFGVQVWAVDKWFSPTENYRRIMEAGCEDRVFPLKADARALPFPREFFDVAMAIDAYLYFGTDERYLPYLAQFLKPQGLIGIVDACFTREVNSLSDVPDYLRPTYHDHWYCVHSVQWWKTLWEKAGLVEVLCAEILPQSDFILAEYVDDNRDVDEEKEIVEALLSDRERLIALFRLVGQRTGKSALLEPPEQGG